MTSLAIAPSAGVTLVWTLRASTEKYRSTRQRRDPSHGYAHDTRRSCRGSRKASWDSKPARRQPSSSARPKTFGGRDDEAACSRSSTALISPGNEVVVVGDEFVAEGPDGEPISMRVVELLEEAFVVDTNHPLAGQKRPLRGRDRRASAPPPRTEIARPRQAAQAHREPKTAGCAHHAGCDHEHDHEHDHPAHEHDHQHARARARRAVGSDFHGNSRGQGCAQEEREAAR